MGNNDSNIFLQTIKEIKNIIEGKNPKNKNLSKKIEEYIENNNNKVIDLKDDEGNNILYHIAKSMLKKKEMVPIIEAFVRAGADPFNKSNDGQTLSDVAAEQGNMKLAALILSKDPAFRSIFSSREKSNSTAQTLSNVSSNIHKRKGGANNTNNVGGSFN